MDDKIYNYIITHPFLGVIFIALFLGFLITLLIEGIKWLVYGDKQLELTEDQKTFRDKTDNWIFRSLTLIIAGVCAYLVLTALNGYINSIALKIIFVLLNTSLPFFIYHLKGKKLVELVISGIFNYFKNIIEKFIKK